MNYELEDITNTKSKTGANPPWRSDALSEVEMRCVELVEMWQGD